jgi:hypothetical protein
VRFAGHGCGSSSALDRVLWRSERLASAVDVPWRAAMADAVEAARQHMQEKAADDLGVERNGR